jgi:nitroimidazol reductase NimA-like FMN-containing flavoprotein (pyridoxamine 5'-phosphate oxidase superfamily)
VFFDRGVQPLSDADCRDLLARTSAGRVSVSVGGLPVVVPVAYCCADPDLVVVTGDGAARRAAVRGDVVTLEVESADPDDPWSVLVIGRSAEIDADEAARSDAVKLRPRSGVPEAHYLRLVPEIVAGYRAPTAG